MKEKSKGQIPNIRNKLLEAIQARKVPLWDQEAIQARKVPLWDQEVQA
jgi:hypothetical protein